MLGEAAINWAATAFAIAAARAGSVSWAEMYRKVLSRGASTRTRLATAPGERGGLSLLPAASRIELVSATTAYVADRFCATRSWL